MRRISCALAGASLLALLAAGPGPLQAAIELDALRDDLRRTQEDFRKLLELQQQTQQRMEELQKKMESLERTAAQPAPPAAASAPAAAAPAPTPVPASAGPAIPPGRLGVNVAGRTLLFDVGVLGSVIGSLSSARDPLLGQRPTFIGQDNRIFPQEVEIAAQGFVDPYVRADVFFDFGEEVDIDRMRGARPVRSVGASLEEAYITSLSLPWGFQLRGGRMRPQFGLLGHLHPHDLPQIDPPNVLSNFLGAERLKENGVEVSWVAPTSFFLELRSGVFSGDNETAFGVGNIRNPLVTGRVKTFLDINDDHGLQLGLSGATGPNTNFDPLTEAPHGTRTVLLGADFKYKWRPVGVPYTQFILAGEYLFSHQRREPNIDTLGFLAPLPLGSLCDASTTGCNRDERHRNRHGFYVFADYQLDQRWFIGTRFDWSQFPPNPNIAFENSLELRRGAREYAIVPYLTFRPSEFFNLRAEYKHVFRNYTKSADEAFLQAIFILGTHPPHPW